MQKVIIVLLFFCTFLILSSTSWWICFLKEITDSRTVSNISWSNGSSKFEKSFVLYLISVGKAAFLLYKTSNRKYFVDVHVVTQWVKSTPSITHGQSVGLLSSAFINEFFIVLFCLSRRLFVCGRYALLTRWIVPIRRSNSTETLLTNSRPWSFVWMEKHLCLHIS